MTAFIQWVFIFVSLLLFYQHDMLTSVPCLHVGTKSEFQAEAGRTVHYPQRKSMSISFFILILLSGHFQLVFNRLQQSNTVKPGFSELENALM